MCCVCLCVSLRERWREGEWEGSERKNERQMRIDGETKCLCSANLDNSKSASWVLSCDMFTMMIELYCLGRRGSTAIQACHKDVMVEAQLLV
jgi:hypothetical protein